MMMLMLMQCSRLTCKLTLGVLHSGPFALHGGDEIVVGVHSLEWPCLFLLFVLLGSSTTGLIIIGRRLAFPSFTAEEVADRFFPCGVVCHYVHQLIDGLRAIPA